MNERLSKAGEETSWPGMDDDEDDVEGDNPTEVIVESAASATQASTSPALATAAGSGETKLPGSEADSTRS